MKTIKQLYERLFTKSNYNDKPRGFRREAIQAIYIFFDADYTALDTPHRMQLEITNIEAYLKKDTVYITIVLSRPGLLIGKRGATIDALNDFLKKWFNRDVIITIKESKLWHF